MGLERSSRLKHLGRLLKNACPVALAYWGFDMNPEILNKNHLNSKIKF